MKILLLLIISYCYSGLSQEKSFTIEHVGKQNISLIKLLVIPLSTDTTDTCEFPNGYDWMKEVPDSIFNVFVLEFNKLIETQDYINSDTLTLKLEWGATEFTFYDFKGGVTNKYIISTKLNSIDFMEAVIVNCEKVMKSKIFNHIFSFYIDLYKMYSR